MTLLNSRKIKPECNILSILRFLLHAILLEWNMFAYDTIIKLQTTKKRLND